MSAMWGQGSASTHRVVRTRTSPDPPDAGGRAYTRLLRRMHVLGERAAACLKQRRRALRHAILSPSQIGTLAQAAMVLNNAWW